MSSKVCEKVQDTTTLSFLYLDYKHDGKFGGNSAIAQEEVVFYAPCPQTKH